jgi:hypothetical protein
MLREATDELASVLRENTSRQSVTLGLPRTDASNGAGCRDRKDDHAALHTSGEVAPEPAAVLVIERLHLGQLKWPG